ncbi:hypothetical protein ECANGB1_1546 [Enterospora canceri]|uniref:Uncharacterized protein n=1 Tax=Enterospora canceri TaxID=1081671 RepID=A0A1Y1S6Z0_9MICR|nr:hypothetical protein ECANGB1_1546 [Enterospora canceri]
MEIKTNKTDVFLYYKEVDTCLRSTRLVNFKYQSKNKASKQNGRFDQKNESSYWCDTESEYASYLLISNYSHNRDNG